MTLDEMKQRAITHKKWKRFFDGVILVCVAVVLVVVIPGALLGGCYLLTELVSHAWHAGAR